MGLDMWVVKMKRINDADNAEAIYGNTEPYSYKEFCYLSKDDIGNYPDMYHDIIPLLTPVTLMCPSWDYRLIKERYGVPKDANQVSFGNCSDGISISYRDYSPEHNAIEIFIENHDLGKYTKYYPKEFLIANEEEIRYWRKEYELGEKMYDLYSEFRDNIDLVLKEKALKSEIQDAKKMTDNINARANGNVIRQKEVKEVLALANRFGWDYLENMPKDIENCGFYLLSEKMAQAAGLHEAYLALDKDEYLFYHEWY